MNKKNLLTVALLLISTQSFASDAIKIRLEKVQGFDETRKEKLLLALEVLEVTLNSESFRQKVLNYDYDGNHHFKDTELNNQEVYENILAASETYKTPSADHQASLHLNLYWPRRIHRWGSVGYGYAGQPDIFMNGNYFDIYDTASVAANIAHEWTHKLGFGHDFRDTPNREHTVPYAIGDIVEKIIRQDFAD